MTSRVDEVGTISKHTFECGEVAGSSTTSRVIRYCHHGVVLISGACLDKKRLGDWDVRGSSPAPVFYGFHDP